MNQLSIVIPTYERVEMTVESFQKVYASDIVGEIVIVDDASSIETFNRLKAITDCMPKVRLMRNETNQDCYKNKMTAVSYAKNQWIIIFDSDNVMDVDYLDRIYEYEWRKDMILQPSFAKPEFNFSAFEGKIFSKENIAGYIDKHMITTMCNAMNYFVNRDEYLRVWKDDINPHTADSIYQVYNWFAAGNKMLVVPNLSYFHRVHNGSHYQMNRHKTANRYYEIEQKLRQLK